MIWFKDYTIKEITNLATEDIMLDYNSDEGKLVAKCELTCAVTDKP